MIHRYFLNIFLDTTFGVGVLYLFLKAADKYITHRRIEGLKTGEYGNPPQIRRWWKQTLVFSLGLVFMKIIVVIVLTWVCAGNIYSIFNQFPIYHRTIDTNYSYAYSSPSLQLLPLIAVF